MHEKCLIGFWSHRGLFVKFSPTPCLISLVLITCRSVSALIACLFCHGGEWGPVSKQTPNVFVRKEYHLNEFFLFPGWTGEGHSGCGAQFVWDIRLIWNQKRARSRYRNVHGLEKPSRLTNVIYNRDPKGRARSLRSKKANLHSSQLVTILSC